ncbi:non-ribosomal peptide synthetase [Paenibacillus lentus]|uniref:Amino acid adenylation domain-containing protein n=1 Tax=Paenibacillus lentus TaxID=1338368 RepID=A0A3Q8S6K5_9BACL|nr:non-ribosomal peptide synthetase [Paenibacillus lentus]AZK48531.1 amino acid adenylation domain-containing protein [Paenibacillus lentus]
MEVFSLDINLIYPLTHPQRRIWYVENISPGTSIHNIGGLIRIYGAVDFDLLEEAINHFIRLNDAIRIRIVEQDSGVQQTVSAYQRRQLPFIDFTTITSDVDVDAWAASEFAQPLPLDGEALYEFTLVKISETESAYLTKVHHIISDGWSFQLMTSHINDLYTQLMRGQMIQEEAKPTYIDYIEQEQKYLTSSRFKKSKHYWTNKFKSVDKITLFPTSNNTRGQRKAFILNQPISDRIRDFTNTHQVSLNTFFIAVMLLYLHKITQQNLIIIGTPVLNRTGVKEKKTFGMFTSSMPFLVQIEQETSLSKFILNCNLELIQSYFHQKYPYNLLVQDLQLQKRGIDQLFQVSVNYYNTSYDKSFGPGWKMKQTEVHNGNQLYPLQLIITEWEENGGLELYFDYKTDDYSASQIEEMFSRLELITEQILNTPHQSIRNLELLLPGERDKLLYECNLTERLYPADQTILDLFEKQSAQSADRVALTYRGQSLTYKELNTRANQLARTLLQYGIHRQTPIAIMGRHSIEIMVAIWAVIKAGAVYIPIDPEYPRERIEYILHDSQAPLLLTFGNDWRTLSYEGTVIRLEDDNLYTQDGSNLGLAGSPNDLVYMIYTSGSTGKPKGAMIENRGLVNYIWWANQQYTRTDNEIFALYSSIAFDLTVTSIFTPLIGGHQIEIYDDDGKEFIIHRILKEKKATIVKLTPAHLSLLKDMELDQLAVHTFIVGGEDLKCALARDIHIKSSSSIAIYNEYGPTETVVGCMIYQYDPERDQGVSVPIGQPIDNVQIYLLNDQLEPVPNGTVGEIYISGDGVARGYLRRPELTQECFVSNPFLKGMRMYRTGDLAVRLDSKDLVYLGRMDHQVKIKGYRIETGEIEHHLLAIDSIKEAVVMDRIAEEQHYLAAYFVAAEQIDVLELRMKLLEVLPSYMIPAYFVQLAELPLSPNGKVDRRFLPDPASMKQVTGQGPRQGRTANPDDIVRWLRDIYKEVLQVKDVQSADNFYRMGGDSIKAIQIVAKVNSAGYKLKVQDILSYPDIHELAAVLEMTIAAPIEQKPCTGEVKALPVTSWFLESQWGNPHFYTQSVFLHLKQKVNIPILLEALYLLLQHHDALRLQHEMKTGKLVYREVRREHLEFDYCDLTSLHTEEHAEVIRSRSELLKASIQLGQGLLFKTMLFERGEDGQSLLLTAHHLIVDGVSWRILLEDLDRLLQSITSGTSCALPAKTHSIQAWAESIEVYSRKQATEYLPYWERVVEEAEDSLRLDFPSTDDRYAVCNTLVRELPESVTGRLLGEANAAFHTQTSELIMASLAMAMREYSGKEKISIELEGHGREELFADVDISRTVGWFTSLFPVNLYLPVRDPSSIIKAVKEQLREIPNKGIDYGILVYNSKRLLHIDKRLLRFNYLGEIDNLLQGSSFLIGEEDIGNETCSSNKLACLVDVVAMVINRKLLVRLTYSEAMFDRESMENLLESFMQKIMEVIQLCLNTEPEFTPSDFATLKLKQDELDILFN